MTSYGENLTMNILLGSNDKDYHTNTYAHIDIRTIFILRNNNFGTCFFSA